MHTQMTIPLNCNISGFYSFFRNRFPKDYKYAGEMHDFWEIVCVMDGTVGVTADADMYLLRKGQAIIHRPMEFHNIWSESENPDILIFSFGGFLPSFSHRVFTMDQAAFSLIHQLSQELPHIFHTDRLRPISIRPDKELKAEIHRKKTELFILSLLSGDETEVHRPSDPHALSYTAMVSYLNQHLDKALTISELAATFHMSEAGIKKIFKKYSGVGIMHYFNSVKMKQAKMLLAGGKSVRETAEALGFSDQNYFSTAFKRMTHLSPSAFKALALRKESEL